MAVQAQCLGRPGLYSCVPQDWMDANSGFYDVCFNLQQQQQQQHKNQNLGFDNSPVVCHSVAFPQSLPCQIEEDRDDIDRFIELQNERLRSALQEQTKQQLAILLSRIESKTISLMRQKDEDIAKAAKKTVELEGCLKRVEMENQAWQRIAKEKEAMVITLTKTLQQVRENVCWFSSGTEDADSCCDFSYAFNNNRGGAAGGYRDEETGQAMSRTEEEEQTKKMTCKACNSRGSCVLFLPCRHLCSCKSCEVFLDCCPVCKSPKKASIEVFLS
ncbi:PREDICTED: probable BOI-related E3 ubiquitin-protein ligase 3 [Nelumbo nucifera]|uniref:BOI-related E3 ubiquitin-protein ligase 3 n=2 Tax=Nelumbo nucifera TaxID=4432 RepID=A0A822Z9F1_NELNU|nr:PREDICTED: probable BOI-related E3 ubiquitin-protein ligase 3 [Nelumbo nucifera]DAD41672.1 TPA_asm: hypothetical protein HUJ06_015995 [Nelumbo nucifera]